MKKEIGLWIDHRQAVIVRLNDGSESIEHIEADFDKRGSFSSDIQSPSESSLKIDLAEDKYERHTAEMVNHYYETVAAHLKEATALLIMGPGPAKTEFQKYLDNHKLGDSIISVEAADKLSDGQIAAKVRQGFKQHVH